MTIDSLIFNVLSVYLFFLNAGKDDFMLFCLPHYRLVFGTLYPAYYSYKAVKTKNVKEYVSTLCSDDLLSFYVVSFHTSLCPYNTNTEK